VRFLLCLCFLWLAGCAPTSLASPESDRRGKSFEAPTAGQSGIYVYREDPRGTIWDIRVSFVGSRKTDLSVELPNMTYIRFESEAGLADLACHTANLRDRHELTLAAGETLYFRVKIYPSTYRPYCLIEAIEPGAAQPAITRLRRTEIL
jgi:hypothetical protein